MKMVKPTSYSDPSQRFLPVFHFSACRAVPCSVDLRGDKRFRIVERKGSRRERESTLFHSK